MKLMELLKKASRQNGVKWGSLCQLESKTLQAKNRATENIELMSDYLLQISNIIEIDLYELNRITAHIY
jgi:hypothetical protein